MRARPGVPVRGFTLVELLVALAVMALLSLMAWRGVDGMARAVDGTQARSDAWLAVQTGVAQWRTDLDALALERGSAPPDLSAPGALGWTGQALLLTRYTAPGEAPGLRVVAWRQRSGAEGAEGAHWWRWQSEVLHTQAHWQRAWQAAQAWAQNPTPALQAQALPVMPAQAWEVFFYRGDAWSHPASSAEMQANTPPNTLNTPNTSNAARAALPDGVRLVLQGAAGQGADAITVDWVSPLRTTRRQ